MAKRKTGKRHFRGILLLFAAVFMLMAGGIVAQASDRTPTYHPPRVKDKKSSEVILFVGDSRTLYYYYKNVQSRKDGLIYQNGGAIDSLRYNKKFRKCSQLAKYLRKALKTYPNASVVFNFGCNGNWNAKHNANRIAREYKKWISAYPGRKFYVASVFPSCISKGQYSRKKIMKLNGLLKQKFPDIYIDSAEFLIREGLAERRMDGKGLNNTGSGFDNLHYSRYASKAAKKYIRKRVTELNGQ